MRLLVTTDGLVLVCIHGPYMLGPALRPTSRILPVLSSSTVILPCPWLDMVGIRSSWCNSPGRYGASLYSLCCPGNHGFLMSALMMVYPSLLSGSSVRIRFTFPMLGLTVKTVSSGEKSKFKGFSGFWKSSVTPLKTRIPFSKANCLNKCVESSSSMV